MMYRARAAAVAVFCLLVAPSTVFAQANASATPPEPLDPDRPDVTNGTHIVDVGLMQIEVGGQYTRADVSARSFGSPFTARIGVFDWLEARMGTDGLLSETDGITRQTGLGNLQLGAKLRLWADPGGVPVLSVLPTMNLPTASADKGLGSGDTDFTVALLTGTDVAGRGHVDFNYGVGTIGGGAGRPHFLQQLASVSASIALNERWNPYAESYWFSRQDPGAGPTTAFDAGAIYRVSPTLAFDAGLQIGLSRAAPGVAVFGGISIVVGDVLGGHGVHERQRDAERRARTRPAHRVR